jgi:hypothetical protein
MRPDRETAYGPQRPSDGPSIGICQSLRQFRSKRNLRPTLEQVSLKRTRAATRCGEVSNDLDRIAQAKCEMEMLDVINDVLQVLCRSGRMAEMPESLRMDRLTTAAPLRMAMKRTQGAQTFIESVDWHSDATLYYALY